MTNTELTILEILCAMALACSSSYLGGRVHQWRRQESERNAAFREGFFRASATLVTLAARRGRDEPSAARHEPDTAFDTRRAA